MIDLSNLEKAIATLESALQIYDENPLREDAPSKILHRDGVIQRFEFSFELSWKTLKRYLEEYGPERVDTFNIRDLFRVGYEQDLLDNPDKWFHYHKMRNQTSHLYDDAKAHEVFGAARNFSSDASYLLERMREKIR